MLKGKGLRILLLILILAAFLRLWRIDQIPVSLFGDELDVGYHAYSILKTGKDYSGNFMPLHFHSFAEWRTPLYLYSAVPTVAIFGISPLGVRLPATVFGILGVWFFYLLVKVFTKKENLSLLSAFLLAISPWHIQYSRAGFEVTQMLALYLGGIYFFYRAVKENGKYLIPAAFLLALTPWVYSTAKFFLPFTLLVIFSIWFKELKKIPAKQIVISFLVFVVVALPITLSTLFGGGTARFQNLSIFTDPTTIPEIGSDRLQDARVRDPGVQLGIQPSLVDRIFHNKIISWSGIFFRNYLQSFSTNFLFIKGDLNLRHSVGDGELYRFDIIFLLLGIVFFLTRPIDRKVKLFLFLWLITAPVPAALTRDGGTHATRLFFLLPVLISIVAMGVMYCWEVLKKYRKIFLFSYSLVLFVSFAFYQHQYWFHYPWSSERWWHAGFKEAVQAIKEVENQYQRIIITTASEPPWIFFLALYSYPPQKWQEQNPLPKEELKWFGKVSHLDKFYFGTAPLDEEGIYGLAEMLSRDTLYLASAKEFDANYIREPERIPMNLKLIKAIAYPSGEPVFYLFTLNPTDQNN